MGMKIVFLDCDGVISPLGGRLFSPDLMKRLHDLVDVTGARIVLSSSWRTSKFGRDQVMRHLAGASIAGFIDITPSLPSASRAEEILAWLRASEQRLDIVNFVALDDIPLALLAPDKTFFSKHAIAVNGNVGLTDTNIKTAIHMLSDSNNYR